VLQLGESWTFWGGRRSGGREALDLGRSLLRSKDLVSWTWHGMAWCVRGRIGEASSRHGPLSVGQLGKCHGDRADLHLISAPSVV